MLVATDLKSRHTPTECPTRRTRRRLSWSVDLLQRLDADADEELVLEDGFTETSRRTVRSGVLRAATVHGATLAAPTLLGRCVLWGLVLDCSHGPVTVAAVGVRLRRCRLLAPTPTAKVLELWKWADCTVELCEVLRPDGTVLRLDFWVHPQRTTTQ